MFRTLVQSQSTPAFENKASEGTFGLTEVTQFPKIRSQKPPLTQRQVTRSQLATVQNSRNPKTERRPNSTWNDFARRNLDKRDMPSTRSSVHIYLEKAAAEVEAEFSADNPRLSNRMKSLEQSPHVKELIGQIEGRIMKKKRNYNKLHNQVRMLEDKLSLMKYQEQYAKNAAQKIDNTDKEKKHYGKEKDLGKVHSKIDDEHYYEQTLRLMISRRKINLANYTPRINIIRSQIRGFKRNIFEAEKDYWRQCVGINSQHRNINSIREVIDGTSNKKKEAFDRELEVYKDTQRFRNMFKIEQDRDAEIDELRRTTIATRRQESLNQQSQEEKNLNSELRNYENYNRKREEHFTRIKKVSNCVQPHDMLPYYNYLNETHRNLQKTIEQMQEELDGLRETKRGLDEEVHDIQFKLAGIDPVETEAMKSTFKDKNREVDEKENHLKQVEEVVATSINCVSRLMFQLYSDFEKEEVNKANREGSSQGVNPSNVEAHLTICGMKIERMMKAIAENNS